MYLFNYFQFSSSKQHSKTRKAVHNKRIAGRGPYELTRTARIPPASRPAPVYVAHSAFLFYPLSLSTVTVQEGSQPAECMV